MVLNYACLATKLTYLQIVTLIHCSGLLRGSLLLLKYFRITDAELVYCDSFYVMNSNSFRSYWGLYSQSRVQWDMIVVGV